MSRYNSLSKPNLCLMLGVLKAHYRVLPAKNIRHLMSEIEEIETHGLQNFNHSAIQYIKSEIQEDMLSSIKSGRDRHIKPIHIELYNFLEKTIEPPKAELPEEEEEKVEEEVEEIITTNFADNDIVVYYIDIWLAKEIKFLSGFRGNLPRHVMTFGFDEQGRFAPIVQVIEARPFGHTPECLTLPVAVKCQAWLKHTLKNLLLKVFFDDLANREIDPVKSCYYYGACKVWRKYLVYVRRALKAITTFEDKKKVSFCTNWTEPHPVPRSLANILLQQTVWVKSLKESLTCITLALQEEA